MPYTLTSTVNTLIKTSPKQSTEVGGENLAQGRAITTETLERYQNHYYIDGNRWLFCKHFTRSAAPTLVDLTDMPKHSQRDNEYEPMVTCLWTSIAAALNYLGLDKNKADEKQFEDEIWELCRRKGWKRGWHDHAVKICEHYGARDIFDCDTPFAKIKTHLADGHPVVISADFTRSGHIIYLRGYDDVKQQWIVCDPYGEYPKYRPDSNGFGIRYSYKLLNKLSRGGEGCIWAHLISKAKT